MKPRGRFAWRMKNGSSYWGETVQIHGQRSKRLQGIRGEVPEELYFHHGWDEKRPEACVCQRWHH